MKSLSVAVHPPDVIRRSGAVTAPAGTMTTSSVAVLDSTTASTSPTHTRFSLGAPATKFSPLTVNRVPGAPCGGS
ncbi:MAG: hypothetical protein BWZ02_02661 [Lentisphaerae bacterium ADurb.BinA184]|nr:MAG: hypothetical protein BWZ02_02661 [Lentisphaerae bacterium ADurb.BinA184]